MDQILALVVAHKWVPLATLVIWAIVRLLKSDVPITPTVPPAYRAWLALLLGAVSGVLEHVAAGQTWGLAIAGGLASALLAISSNEVVVEPGTKVVAAVRSLVKKPLTPTLTLGVVGVVHGMVLALAGWLAVGVLGAFLVGCGWWTPAKTAKAEEVGKEVGIDMAQCVLQKIEAGATDPKAVAVECAMAEVADALKIFTAANRIKAAAAASASASARLGAPPGPTCPPAPSTATAPSTSASASSSAAGKK